MNLFDRLLTRRREQPAFGMLPQRVRRRLGVACRELSEAEERIAERLGLEHPPRLLLVDEERAAILNPVERAKIEREAAPQDKLVIAPRRRPHYTLDELLAQCDSEAELTAEERRWADSGPVGRELL